MGNKLSMSLLYFLTWSHLFSHNIGTPLVPALYILGDSVLDSGNNNDLSTLAKVNYLPYGSNFKLGPTGRFTNGRTIADFVAEYLGLPYVPPALGLKKRNITTGVNYASGSCGILPETGSNMGKCLTLDNQLDMLQELVEKDLPRLIPARVLPQYLADSIMIFSVGSNDYINNYLRPDFFNSSDTFSPLQFAQLLNERLSKDLQRVYHMGFRKIIVFALGLIGCLPAVRDMISHTGTCVSKVNGYVTYYNVLLAASLLTLTVTLEGSTFVLGGGITLNLTGVTDVSSPCCKRVKETGLCIKGQPELPCKGVKSHYFWDDFHPTQTVYRKMVESCITSSAFCTPMSIKDLVQD
ncbi:GDSL lipase/esterase [Dillenia turbinata]|uniref:GDSL lipase/esterase n=1 Tax=Dillenia turbinata TaxID=194707 RepID=A0AAN8UNY5_9MAGN